MCGWWCCGPACRDLGTEGAGDADIALRRCLSGSGSLTVGPRYYCANRALVPTGSYGMYLCVICVSVSVFLWTPSVIVPVRVPPPCLLVFLSLFHAGKLFPRTLRGFELCCVL